jgi:hypothetical protein
MAVAGENEISVAQPSAEAMLRIPFGVVSPLWVLFGGAAVSGAAWWWMSQWARPANLEAMFGRMTSVATTVPPMLAAPAEPVVEAAPVLKKASETAKAAAEAALEVSTDRVNAAVESLTAIEAETLDRLQDAAAPLVQDITPAPVSLETKAIAGAEIEPAATMVPKPKKKPTDPKLS